MSFCLSTLLEVKPTPFDVKLIQWVRGGGADAK